MATQQLNIDLIKATFQLIASYYRYICIVYSYHNYLAVNDQHFSLLMSHFAGDWRLPKRAGSDEVVDVYHHLNSSQ